jgi:hypothetical protein
VGKKIGTEIVTKVWPMEKYKSVKNQRILSVKSIVKMTTMHRRKILQCVPNCYLNKKT